jgi:S1-C subfamily serine protease
MREHKTRRAELGRVGFWSAVAFLGLALSCAAPQASHGQENDSIAALKRMGDAFALVAAKASPGVVGIRTTKKTTRAGSEAASNPPSNPSDENAFDFFFRRQTPQDDTPVRERTQQSLGSGFIISEEGYIITNNHMVANAEKVMIELVDGRTMEAQVVGTDAECDVAVVKIKADGLKPMPFGDSESLRIGEWVLAIGNPLGLSHTITAGIVSAKGRSGFNVATYENFIQTDAAINLGNSGGPLINLDGQAVGINTFILGPGAGNVGIGFAIPINTVKDVVDQLIKTGTVERGYLGMIPQDLTPELAEEFGLSESRGAVLAQVEADSPAGRTGMWRRRSGIWRGESGRGGAVPRPGRPSQARGTGRAGDHTQRQSPDRHGDAGQASLAGRAARSAARAKTAAGRIGKGAGADRLGFDAGFGRAFRALRPDGGDHREGYPGLRGGRKRPAGRVHNPAGQSSGGSYRAAVQGDGGGGDEPRRTRATACHRRAGQSIRGLETSNSQRRTARMKLLILGS